MRNFITVILILFIAFFSVPAQSPKIKKTLAEVPQKSYIIKNKIKEPAWSFYQSVQNTSASAEKNSGPVVLNSENTSRVLVDSCRNGYGWLNSSIRGIDYYDGLDAFGSPVDFVLLGYRQYIITNPSSGIIGATTIDVGNGLASGTRYKHIELNQDLSSGTLGGRYPGVVALDRPFIHFNQYLSGDNTATPAISSPYLITDYGTYGSAGGAWTPSYAMDQGYTHHDSPGGNRLWNGPVTIVKDAEGVYHYCGVYANWYLESESFDNDFAILNATSSDPTLEWTINTNPVLIDPQVFTFVSPSIALNSSGFGVLAGTGHSGYHEGTSYFYEELRVVLMTTTDYGATWSAARQVEWAELGIPTEITAADSFYYYVDDTTTEQYIGRAFVGTNFDADVLVSEDNNIYIAFNMLWGRPGDEGWYPNWRQSGPHVAVSTDGSNTFQAHRIAINNGFFVGDSIIPGVPANFFESEIDLALDETGNLYAAWLDRPNTPVELAEKPRYGTADPEYKTDAFAARSTDGGVTWSDWINVTNTVSEDEYQLKMAKNANSRDNGTVYIAYCLVDPNSPIAVPNGDDNYTDRVNRVWVAEAHSFPDTTVGIADQNQGHVLANFYLKQNYPNPFNPRTRIEFVAGTNGLARLDVYNLNGQKVARIFNAQVQKGNRYTVDFDATHLAAGIYVYRLLNGTNSQTQKMVLVK